LKIAELRNASMSYGALNALCDVSYCIEAGEAVAVLGPNGAGKTTSLQLLTGLKKIQKGEVSLFGANPRSPKARRFIGVTPQDAAFPHAQKVGELIAFAQSHYSSPANLAELLDAFNLSDLIGKMALELSGGQQRSLSVALAFCGNPKAVFLDEPTTGIDAASRHKLWRYIKKYKQAGGAIFLTTHYLEDAEMIADRVVLLNQGKIVRSGTLQEIKQAVNVRVIRFSSDVTNCSLSSARQGSIDGSRLTFLSMDADDTVRSLVNSKIAFRDLEVLPASLEDAVAELLPNY